MRKIFTYFFLLLSLHQATGQVVLADTQLVCKGESVRLFINPTLLNDLDFCVEELAFQDGLYFFTSCRQLSFEDAFVYAKLMKGNLATGSTSAKNGFLFSLLPNDLHWLGYIQDSTHEGFNDPPDPASGYQWMSGIVSEYTDWVTGEPNNYEDKNPGRHIIQGCRRTAAWCDVGDDDGHRYKALIETPNNEVPVFPNIRILWETGDTTPEITIPINESRYYHASVFIDDYEIKDSIFINTARASSSLRPPGGCGDPFKWGPSIETPVPIEDLEITWSFGGVVKEGELSPKFETDQDGEILAMLQVRSKSCDVILMDTSTTYFLEYPFVPTEPFDYEAKLNEIVNLNPENVSPYFVYDWSPPKHLNETDIANPNFMASDPITYTLTINDGYDCITEEVFNFTIDPRINIYFPEGFSPNNDGRNDQFNIITNEGYYGLFKKFVIKNKWGAIVYTTEETWSWDGKTDGQRVPVGAYIYKLDYEIEEVPYSKSGVLWVVY